MAEKSYTVVRQFTDKSGKTWNPNDHINPLKDKVDPEAIKTALDKGAITADPAPVAE